MEKEEEEEMNVCNKLKEFELLDIDDSSDTEEFELLNFDDTEEKE